MTEETIKKLPPKLQTIVDMFQEARGKEKLELLLEFAMELPELPPRFQGEANQMEQVVECQTPFFMSSEVINGKMMFYYDAPLEAPTIRGFASILAQGINNISAEDVLKIPTDLYVYFGLNEVLSPLRLRGMNAVLFKIKAHATQYLAQK